MVEPLQIIQTLGKSRTVYHSEKDFQHAFAWELHRSGSEWDVRLEVPVRTSVGAIHLDVVARSPLGQVAIELKYKTRKLVVEANGEDFNLASHAAQDLARYDFFKDLARVEAFAHAGPNRTGYAVFLTNDSAYWKAPSGVGHGYGAFAMNDGRDVSGNLCWGERASEGTRKGRHDEIAIGGRYHLQWMRYSSLAVKAYGDFRYLCVRAAA